MHVNDPNEAMTDGITAAMRRGVAWRLSTARTGVLAIPV